jgi:predicted nuclease of predicted toxin-antitoxin system
MRSNYLTKDEDFAARKILSRAGPAIVWLRVGNCTNRALLGWFVPLLPGVFERLDRGEELIELI